MQGHIKCQYIKLTIYFCQHKRDHLFVIFLLFFFLFLFYFIKFESRREPIHNASWFIIMIRGNTEEWVPDTVNYDEKHFDTNGETRARKWLTLMLYYSRCRRGPKTMRIRLDPSSVSTALLCRTRWERVSREYGFSYRSLTIWDSLTAFLLPSFPDRPAKAPKKAVDDAVTPCK